jgi:hypothetical protein
MKLASTFLLSILAVWSSHFEHNRQSGSEELASVSVRMTFKSPGFTGYGGYLSLVNVESGKLYESTIKMGFRPYIVVEDLPMGHYEVVYLHVITGGPYLFLDDQQLYNQILVEESKNYYLGNYLTKKIKPTFKLHVKITKEEDDPREKIYKKIGKIDKKWTSLEIDYSQSLFKNDSSKVIIRN